MALAIDAPKNIKVYVYILLATMQSPSISTPFHSTGTLVAPFRNKQYCFFAVLHKFIEQWTMPAKTGIATV